MSQNPKLVVVIYLDNKLPKESKCSKRIKLNEDQYKYYISKDSKPSLYNKRVKTVATYWNRMTPEDRLRFHLSELAEGKDYSYDLLVD